MSALPVETWVAALAASDPWKRALEEALESLPGGSASVEKFEELSQQEQDTILNQLDPLVWSSCAMPDLESMMLERMDEKTAVLAEAVTSLSATLPPNVWATMIAEEVPGNQISPPLRPHVLTNLLQMTKEEYPTFKAVWGSVLATDAAYDAEYYQRILQDVKVEDASVTDGATCLLATCHRVVATRGFSSQNSRLDVAYSIAPVVSELWTLQPEIVARCVWYLNKLLTSLHPATMYDEVAAVLRLIDTPLLDHIVKLGTAVTWTNAAPVNVALACLESIVPWSLVRRLFSGLLPYDTYWFFAETCLFTAHDFPSAVAFLIACCLKCVRTDVLRSAKLEAALLAFKGGCACLPPSLLQASYHQAIDLENAGLPGDDTGLTAVFPHPPDAPNTRISAPRRSSVQKSATPMQSTLSSGAIRAAVSSVPRVRSAAHSAATQAPSLKLQQDIDDGDGAVSSTQSAVQSQPAPSALVPSPGDSMFTDDDADAVTIDRVDATPSMLEEAELFPTTSDGSVARSVSAGGSHEAVERVADSVRVLAVKMTDILFGGQANQNLVKRRIAEEEAVYTDLRGMVQRKVFGWEINEDELDSAPPKRLSVVQAKANVYKSKLVEEWKKRYPDA